MAGEDTPVDLFDNLAGDRQPWLGGLVHIIARPAQQAGNFTHIFQIFC